LILKGYGFPMDAHLLWKSIKEKFPEITSTQNSSGADCLSKLVRPVGQTCQTGLAKTAASKLQRRKRHRSNKDSTSQTSSLPSASHGGSALWLKTRKRRSRRKLRMKKKMMMMIMTLILIS
jgi:hypothetical protein